MKTYDVKEAAAYCKCQPETIREHIRSGRLAAPCPGGNTVSRSPHLTHF